MVSVIFFVIIVFVSFLISSVAGFAGAAFAVPLSAGIIGLVNARCAVNIISIAFTLTICIQQRKYIRIKEIIPILAIVFAGMVCGIFINSYITSEEILIRILGVCILIISAFRLFVDREIRLNKAVAFLIIFASGIINYLFLCGGIVLVIYMSRKYKDKDCFRGFNGVIFLFQSIVMLFVQQGNGMYRYDNIMMGLLGIVPVVIATWLGNRIVKKISQKHFEKITYILLMAMSLLLIME